MRLLSIDVVPSCCNSCMKSLGLDSLAGSQHGLVTRTQALRTLSTKQLEGWVGRRVLVPVRPGVYRFRGVPESWEQRLLAACLAADGVASHRAAARVWLLEGVASLRLEITVPLGRVVRLPGVRAHRSNRLGPEFLTVHRGIPVTTPARTLVDLSAVTRRPRSSSPGGRSCASRRRPLAPTS